MNNTNNLVFKDCFGNCFTGECLKAMGECCKDMGECCCCKRNAASTEQPRSINPSRSQTEGEKQNETEHDGISAHRKSRGQVPPRKEATGPSANMQINDAIIRVVANEIGPDWKHLSRVMEIKEGKIKVIGYDNRHDNTVETVTQMLLFWKAKSSHEATVLRLEGYLKEVDRTDIADEIKEMACKAQAAMNSAGK